jgi:hypothetical protein
MIVLRKQYEIALRKRCKSSVVTVRGIRHD